MLNHVSRALRSRAHVAVRPASAICRRWSSSAPHVTHEVGTKNPALTAHDAVVQKEFNMQSSMYAAKYTGDLQRTLGWLRDGLWPFLRPRRAGPNAERPPIKVLDVCAGTGAMTRLLSPHVTSVTALDLTPGMLREARTALHNDIKARGKDPEDPRNVNVTFVNANAAEMPFADGTFDLVVSRFAVHHFSDPQPIFREIARVTKPGGAVGICDIVTPFEFAHFPAIRARLNDLERMRDPSHTFFLPLPELQWHLSSVGLNVSPATTVHERILELTEWFRTANTPEHERNVIESALRSEVSAENMVGVGPLAPDSKVRTGFRPFLRDSTEALPVSSSNVNAEKLDRSAGKKLMFRHTDVLTTAIKPLNK